MTTPNLTSSKNTTKDHKLVNKVQTQSETTVASELTQTTGSEISQQFMNNSAPNTSDDLIDTQVVLLQKPGLLTVQRQELALHIGQVYGNSRFTQALNRSAEQSDSKAEENFETTTQEKIAITNDGGDEDSCSTSEPFVITFDPKKPPNPDELMLLFTMQFFGVDEDRAKHIMNNAGRWSWIRDGKLSKDQIANGKIKISVPDTIVNLRQILAMDKGDYIYLFLFPEGESQIWAIASDDRKTVLAIIEKIKQYPELSWSSELFMYHARTSGSTSNWKEFQANMEIYLEQCKTKLTADKQLTDAKDGLQNLTDRDMVDLRLRAYHGKSLTGAAKDFIDAFEQKAISRAIDQFQESLHNLYQLPNYMDELYTRIKDTHG